SSWQRTPELRAKAPFRIGLRSTTLQRWHSGPVFSFRTARRTYSIGFKRSSSAGNTRLASARLRDVPRGCISVPSIGTIHSNSSDIWKKSLNGPVAAAPSLALTCEDSTHGERSRAQIQQKV